MLDKTPPEISVVVPCYNHAHYLAECLTSIAAQTYPHWKVIVVDDASPDGELMQSVIDQIGEERIRLVRHETNRGLGASRNTGIRESTTDLFVCVDADDKLDPLYLKQLVPVIWNDDTLDCVFPDIHLFGRSNDVITFHGPAPGENLLCSEDTIPGAGTMMRRRLWEHLGGYDESDVLRHGREDFEFYIRAFSSGCKIARVAEPLYLYRISHTSMNITCRLHDHTVARYIYDKHRALFDSAGEGPRFLGFAFDKATLASYQKGLRVRAFLLGSKAWLLCPSRARLRSVVKTTLPSSLVKNLNRGEVRRRIPFWGYPLKGEERHTPFFIIGAGRSGSTLLRRILTAHSELHIPPETFVLDACIKKFRHYGKRMDWPDLVHLILSQFEFHPEFHTFHLSLRPVVNQLLNAPHKSRNLAFILDSVYRYHAQEHGHSMVRWGDKTPLNSLIPDTLQWIRKIFPDAQFIHLIRDGCDVVYSCLRYGFFADITDAANRWLLMVRQSRRFVQKYPEQSFEVRYEDLVTQPEATIRSMCQFLNAEYEPQMLTSEDAVAKLGDIPGWFWHKQAREPIKASNPGKGRRYFSMQEKEELQQLIGQELELLGYPPCTAKLSDPSR
jgi:protein-tyrosine sulfotransferase